MNSDFFFLSFSLSGAKLLTVWCFCSTCGSIGRSSEVKGRGATTNATGLKSRSGHTLRFHLREKKARIVLAPLSSALWSLFSLVRLQQRRTETLAHNHCIYPAEGSGWQIMTRIHWLLSDIQCWSFIQFHHRKIYMLMFFIFTFK